MRPLKISEDLLHRRGRRSRLPAGRQFVSLTVALPLLTLVSHHVSAQQEEHLMNASGSFEVVLEPQRDQQAPAGRMLIKKRYSGDLNGKGLGQMISKRTEGGASAYSAVEEVEGRLGHKSGSFTLIHSGYMDSQTRELKV